VQCGITDAKDMDVQRTKLEAVCSELATPSEINVEMMVFIGRVAMETTRNVDVKY
jgi:hypothetical protein